MSRKILYLINPVSGSRRRFSLQQIIAEKTQEQDISFEINAADKSGHYTYLKSKIKNENITDVVICGGDGTVNQVTAALLGIDVNIGIVPAGSGNGLAFSAKIPKEAARALQIIFNGKSAKIDGFHINNHFGCMLCGIGFDAQVAHDFALDEQRGLATYVKQSVKNFVKASPYKFHITIKGKTFSTEAFFISIANSNQFGNNFTIAPKASLDDGLLDIIVVKRMSKARMLWAVLQQIRPGKVVHSDEKNFHKCNNVHKFLLPRIII